jgi:hypothetical protein
VTITFLDNKPFEVFTSIGKSGYSRWLMLRQSGADSLALRSGVDPKEVNPAA